MNTVKALRIVSHRKLTRQQIFNMKRLWRMVPYIHCKGLCQRDCSNVPIMPVEALYLIEKHNAVLLPAIHGLNEQVMMPTLGLNKPCEFLRDGRCSIYEDRPLVCRMFGHPILTLDCGHGCKARTPMKVEAFMDLMKSMSMILELDGDKPLPEISGAEAMEHMIDQVDHMVVECEVEDGEDDQSLLQEQPSCSGAGDPASQGIHETG